MASASRTEFQRLILKIERDLLTQARQKGLLTVADATMNIRQTLQAIKARIKRARRVKGVPPSEL